MRDGSVLAVKYKWEHVIREKEESFYSGCSGVDTPSDKPAADKKILHITAIMCSTYK